MIMIRKITRLQMAEAIAKKYGLESVEAISFYSKLNIRKNKKILLKEYRRLMK